jgi:hypothetical protein
MLIIQFNDDEDDNNNVYDTNLVSVTTNRISTTNDLNTYILISSLNVIDDGAVLLRSIIWTYPSSLCFATKTFRGMALPSSSGEPTLLGPVD